MYLPGFTALLLLAQWAGLSSALTHHNVEIKREIGSVYSRVSSFNMSIPVDHFNTTDTRTYNNRYWVNDTYYKPGGPVFFLDHGEAGVTTNAASCSLAESGCTSSIMKLAAKYNGVAILFEHRYYGDSMPVPMNRTSNSDVLNYKYLTVEQALEDVVYFAKNFKIKGCQTPHLCSAVQPSRAPWVWLGGSYPGIRGALIRTRNPEIFQAVWASSAPVQAVYDGSIYYNTIEDSMPANCTADIRAAVKYADEIMAGRYGSAAFLGLQRLSNVGTALSSNIKAPYAAALASASSLTAYDIGRRMASPLTANFQYKGPTEASHRLCNYIQSYNPMAKPANATDPFIGLFTNPGNRVVGSRGIAATYNASVALEAYLYASRRWWARDTPATGSSPSDVSIDDLEMPGDEATDDKAWIYQVMTEFGWFQGSNPANVTIVSKYYNYTAIQARLALNFRNPNLLPSVPAINNVNKYGGWNMNPSNVMFTEGQYDPWRSGSPMSNQPWIDAPLRTVVQDVPACGKSPNGNNVFGLVFPGRVHVPDLTQLASAKFDSSSPVYQGVQLFSKALDAWLPCFKAVPGSGSGGGNGSGSGANSTWKGY